MMDTDRTGKVAIVYAAAGVRVNAVSPGPILTENLEHSGTGAKEAAANAMPLRRVGRPEEVAAGAVPGRMTT